MDWIVLSSLATPTLMYSPSQGRTHSWKPGSDKGRCLGVVSRVFEFGRSSDGEEQALVYGKRESSEPTVAAGLDKLPQPPLGTLHTVFLCALDSRTNGLKLVASSLATGSGLNQNNHFKKR